jgi:oxygen-independent coproporphyrinogen-3 oxidase
MYANTPLPPHLARATGAPRYTSYPTAPNFHAGVAAADTARWLRRVKPGTSISLYLHVPFCERLCWFCACRTQGTRTRLPLESYLESLVAEIGLVADLLPSDVRVARLHLGGGTPTILSPAQIGRVAGALSARFDLAGAEISVEIDPTCVDAARIDALCGLGMTRASIGVQDFAPEVQAAIGRSQSFAATETAVADLRAAGIASLNTDLVYGLPLQTPERFARSLAQLLALAPDRIALFGYAHVPWMATRQRMIREEALPGPRERLALFAQAEARLGQDGYRAIGIDHFAQPGDILAQAAAAGRLRRNFQGYTDDTCDVLIGLGASAISRFPEGYAQNASATAAYQACIRGASLATTRGFRMGPEDRMRARAIEMLMCDFRIDLAALRTEFGDFADRLWPLCARAAAAFPSAVTQGPAELRITAEARPLTRLIAMEFDAYADGTTRHSQAI